MRVSLSLIIVSRSPYTLTLSLTHHCPLLRVRDYDERETVKFNVMLCSTILCYERKREHGEVERARE